MFITLATDMALRRQRWFVEHVEGLCMILVMNLVIHGDHEPKTSRIRNLDGKIISEWSHK